MNVFLEICIQHMLQQARETMIVFRHDKDKRIGFIDCRGKFRVFERLTSVIDREADVSDIDQIGAHIGAFCDMIDHEMRGVFARATLPRRSQNYGGKDWPNNI